MNRNKLLIVVSFLAICVVLHARDFVVQNGQYIKVAMPSTKREVAQTALDMFRSDIAMVLSATLTDSRRKDADICLDIDKQLPREGFRINVDDGRLFVSGGDEHGLAYGILEISRLMGVSPWEYWADCTPRKRQSFVLRDGYNDEQHPHVAYRGIFINDEDWGLNPWATRQEPEAWTIRSGRIKGAIGPKVNERIFQLLLRLRANYYWPAMHECSQPFFTIAGNREMAKKYGIYVGGSHCEPMATSPAAEWGLRGEGEYNYVTNKNNVLRFWKDRVEEVRNQEIVYTLGMRGVHDGAMQGVKTLDEKTRYLQMVIDDQRKMLQADSDTFNYQLSTLNSQLSTFNLNIPQVFIPYKEVLDIYRNGLRVPDDVTLMWTDDNYGYIRHFPDFTENSRSGGNGLYYHCSYWGRPHDYLWLNSMPLNIMHHQLQCAYESGIRQIWALNVGDIKPSELQTEMFMDMAWYGNLKPETCNLKPETWNLKPETCNLKPETCNYLNHFAAREFGDSIAHDVTAILDSYFTQTQLCKPEFMAGTRVEESDKAYWNKVRPMPGDWDKKRVAWRISEYQNMSDRVETLYRLVPDDRKDAFFQLVKYPVQAAAQMSFKYLCADRCEQAHDSIQSLTYIYNKVCANGKWDGIMDASPRNLPVFHKVTPDMLPEYPDSSEWIELTQTEPGTWNFEPGTWHLEPETLTLQVRLLPTHPVEGNHLCFAVSIDNGPWTECSYETYGRSEEWKQNVLRGYAQRTFTIAIDHSRKHHTIVIKPLTKGVSVLSVMNKRIGQ